MIKTTKIINRLRAFADCDHHCCQSSSNVVSNAVDPDANKVNNESSRMQDVKGSK